MKPILKWAGGKKQLLPEIMPLIREYSKTYNGLCTYIEPFIGGGAVFCQAVVEDLFTAYQAYDINKDLIDMYCVICQYPQYLSKVLKKHQTQYNQATDQESYFKKQRSLFNLLKSYTDTTLENLVLKSALLIFLNKTGFNGLYRENKKGQFNTSFGKKNKVSLPSLSDIESWSKCLDDPLYYFGCANFKDLEYRPKSDRFKPTLYYFDPPYTPVKKDSFVSYSSTGWTLKDLKRLSEICFRIDCWGHKFIMSNSCQKDSPVAELFKDYKITEVQAKRNINSKGDERQAISELLITNI